MLITGILINNAVKMLMAGTMAVSSQTASVPKAFQMSVKQAAPVVAVTDLKASTISVSTIKVEWKAEKGRDYCVECHTDTQGEYIDNVYFEFRGNDMCYINGLREGSEYDITVTPEPKKNDKKNTRLKGQTVKAETEKVEVIWEFEPIDGWTSAMAGERASGLTAQPASVAIYGTIPDPVTHTGIRRDNYGDYCVAMGLHFGLDGDRYLVEMNNGTQFTVKQCDSKGWADDGEGKWHWFGGEGNGKCIIEFIYDDASLPSCVAYSGSWGYWNWYGLDLGSNIKSIKKINYGEPIEY
jgi:hypothetical protein